MSTDTENQPQQKLTVAYPREVRAAADQAAPIIAEVVLYHRDVTVGDILGPSKFPWVIAAREDAMATVVEQFPNWSYRVVGRIFNKDHKAVWCALKRVGAFQPRPRNKPKSRRKSPK